MPGGVDIKWLEETLSGTKIPRVVATGKRLGKEKAKAKTQGRDMI